MPITKPPIFIGCSTEGLETARALDEHLERDTEPLLWVNETFPPSSTYIESLEKSLSRVEFAVLVATPDDMRVMRGESGQVPRDNIVFELGLFMGRLGRERCSIVAGGEDTQLPSDLDGIATVSYNPNRSDRNLRAATSPAATKIIRAVRGTSPLITPRTTLLNDSSSPTKMLCTTP